MQDTEKEAKGTEHHHHGCVSPVCFPQRADLMLFLLQHGFLYMVKTGALRTPKLYVL